MTQIQLQKANFYHFWHVWVILNLHYSNKNHQKYCILITKGNINVYSIDRQDDYYVNKIIILAMKIESIYVPTRWKVTILPYWIKTWTFMINGGKWTTPATHKPTWNFANIHDTNLNLGHSVVSHCISWSKTMKRLPITTKHSQYLPKMVQIISIKSAIIPWIFTKLL